MLITTTFENLKKLTSAHTRVMLFPVLRKFEVHFQNLHIGVYPFVSCNVTIDSALRHGVKLFLPSCYQIYFVYIYCIRP